LLQLHTWYRAEQLVDMCQILTYPRKDIVINRKDIEEHWSKKITDSLLDGILKNAPVSNISSTEIRRIVSEKGINLIQPMVHSKVFSLINDLKLYQS